MRKKILSLSEDDLSANVQNAFSESFLTETMYLHEFDYSREEIKKFVSKNGKEFSVCKGNASDIGEILKLQDSVVKGLDDSDIYFPLTRAELIESMLLDTVYCVRDGNNIVSFAVAVSNRKSDRNLCKYLPGGQYKYSDVMTFDAVSVSENYRGNGLQKLLIELVLEKAEKSGIKCVAATVSPKNKYSENNFIACGFKSEQKAYKMYGGLERKLLKKEI